MVEGVHWRFIRTTGYRNALQRFFNMRSFRRNLCRNVDDLPRPDVIIGSCVHPYAVDTVTHFVGNVPHDSIPRELNRLDIYVAMSRLDSESFGVAIVEASACGLPVVVSNVGGLPEVVEDGKTGVVMPKENPQALAQVLARLALDPEQRALLGHNGQLHVRQQYEWNNNVSRMLQVYEELLDTRRSQLAA